MENLPDVKLVFKFSPFDDPAMQTDIQFSTQHVLIEISPFRYDTPAVFPEVPETPENVKAILPLIDLLVLNQDAIYFLRPVDVVLDNAPLYYDIIKSPIDLQKMRNKAHRDQYTTFKEFIDDIHLLVNNAILYNKDSDSVDAKTVYHASLSLSHYCAELLETLNKNPSDIISKSSSDLADRKIGGVITQLQFLRKEHNRKVLKNPTNLKHKTSGSRSRLRFSDEEFKQLLDSISHLHSHALIGVVEILAKKTFSSHLVDTPLAIDLRVLQEDQLEKLKLYVDNCIKEGKGDQYYFSWRPILTEELEKVREDYSEDLQNWRDVPCFDL